MYNLITCNINIIIFNIILLNMSVYKNSKKNIYIYTKNHNSKFSLASLLRILRKKLPNYNLITTNKFNYNSPHILIEGFNKDFILK